MVEITLITIDTLKICCRNVDKEDDSEDKKGSNSDKCRERVLDDEKVEHKAKDNAAKP